MNKDHAFFLLRTSQTAEIKMMAAIRIAATMTSMRSISPVSSGITFVGTPFHIGS